MNPLIFLARPEIVSLKPYAHAAWLPSLTRMHANEAPWRPKGDTTNAGLNRYPEPQPQALIERLASLYGVAATQVLATRGADEAIDVLSRIYLRAGSDAILQCGPTFGMYQVAARIQGASLRALRAASFGARLFSVRLGRCERDFGAMIPPTRPTPACHGKPAGVIAAFQIPGSNALETAKGLRTQMEELKKRFPPGMDYRVSLDTTAPVNAGIREISETLAEAICSAHELEAQSR